MSKREVMEQALEALETEAEIYRLDDPEDGPPESMVAVIFELKAELAKPEPKPVAWMMENADYPKIGRNLTFTPHDRWHVSWAAIPLYRMEDI